MNSSYSGRRMVVHKSLKWKQVSLLKMILLKKSGNMLIHSQDLLNKNTKLYVLYRLQFLSQLYFICFGDFGNSPSNVVTLSQMYFRKNPGDDVDNSHPALRFHGDYFEGHIRDQQPRKPRVGKQNSFWSVLYFHIKLYKASVNVLEQMYMGFLRLSAAVAMFSADLTKITPTNGKPYTS